MSPSSRADLPEVLDRAEEFGGGVVEPLEGVLTLLQLMNWIAWEERQGRLIADAITRLSITPRSE